VAQHVQCFTNIWVLGTSAVECIGRNALLYVQ